MLFFSTRPDNVSLMNLAGHLLQETPSKVQEAVELTGMFRAEKSSWDDCLRVANMLLDNGQIDPAKELIAKLDPAKFIKHVSNAAQVKLLLNTSAYFQRPAEIFRLLEDVKIIRLFGGETLVDLKLDIGHKLIMQGQRYTAKKILITINPDKLTNKDHFDALGLLYIHLSMFDKASSVFNNTVRRVYCLKYVFCDITSNQLKLQ